ncbi:MAG: TRAP transporter substrate-binding protein [Planctomycetaceae bacterium]|nr:TRAP transporter substrate-binding protein [Planctomycetaceae bacterium]
MHRITRIALSVFALALVAATASAGQELRMSQVSAQDGAIGQSMDRWAKMVEERTEGRYVINTFHNAQLGAERDNVEGIQLGNLDIAVVNQSVLGNFVPEISVVDLPYVIQNYDHADKIFLGEIGKDFLARLDNVGIKGLAIWESGFRNLTNSKRDVNDVDDVSGLRIRVMENQIHQDLWRALGADAVPMAWGDAYTAMQQGAIDGQENPTTVIDKNNVVEVNKKLAVTEHCYATVFIIMSPARWASISPEDQKIFMETLDEANGFERELSRKMDAEAIETLKSKGMVVTTPDKAGFVEKSQPVREKYGSRFADTLKKIEELK